MTNRKKKHPLGQLIIDALVPGQRSSFALDKKGKARVAAALRTSVARGKAQPAFDALVETIGFLSLHEGQEAVDALIEIVTDAAVALRRAGVNMAAADAKFKKFSGRATVEMPRTKVAGKPTLFDVMLKTKGTKS